jgi:hypothetical protein
MDRGQAIRLVGKLRTLAADPAATGPERAAARAKADALDARFRLGIVEEGQPRRQTRRRYPDRGVRVSSPDPEWTFDSSGDNGSFNVKVEHYWDGSDWKITIGIKWWTGGASRSALAAAARWRDRRR